MNYKIKDYFKGSTGQLIQLGKQATKLYREQYGADPEKVTDEKYGEINCYPEELLITLPKPVKRPVTDIFCKPVVIKDVEHHWECKFKQYDEYDTAIRTTIKGKLHKHISYTTNKYGYEYHFKLKDSKYTYHIDMNANHISNEIVNKLLNAKINDNISMQLLDAENGYAKLFMKINDINYKIKKLDVESLVQKIKEIQV